ncbi:3'-5' exonuclease [Hymenobacter sp. H14-R3]|uniref:3'-5' exonuclease n=1 Tax=Hymenobacter sp. H14-R3 TaxID=3046308 RepID=UPI0024B8F263|nr:3'-5' exonuclease [Hymenobacter sp. H14-R3]MDJ0367408.1 3'-5' exonuclease [Hymenobacter sp. H14-R3]
MSSQPAFYFLHHAGLSSEKCSWRREHFELTADGRLSSVTEREDKISFTCLYPKLWLPAGVVMSTRDAYRAAKLRHVQALRLALKKVRDEQAARKLLRGGAARNQHGAEEAGALELMAVALEQPPVALAQTPAVLAGILDDYTVFDCETTGFSHEKDHLLEIAATRYTNGKPVDSMQSFVRYTGYIPPRITELTGISTKQVFHAPEALDVMKEFRRVAGDSLLVGHNVTFDLRFVNATRARLGAYQALPNSFLCTQVVATRRYPAPHKLGELCARFGISNTGAHRAMADVLMTAKLLQHMHQAQPITADLLNATGTAKPKAKAAAIPTLFAA